MNILPINKIILASFAFAFTNFKKILEMSVIPVAISIPFLTIFPDMLEIIQSVYAGEKVVDIQMPENMMIYLLLFSYGYLSLSINVYRLVVLGADSVSSFVPVLDFNKIIRFIALTLFVGLATMIPVMITGVAFLQLIMYFLILPLTLNFINISIDLPSKYRWGLSFPTQVNLFFLQIILPSIVGMLFSALISSVGMPIALEWVVKVIVFYWTLINLALCYQLIVKQGANS